jgi:hypothetical protein
MDYGTEEIKKRIAESSAGFRKMQKKALYNFQLSKSF